MPERIQRKRTRGWRMPSGAVYVGRGSKYGNPYRIENDVFDATSVVARFEKIYVTGTWEEVGLPSPAAIRAELAGKDLACWCPPGQPCHADVLMRLANG